MTQEQFFWTTLEEEEHYFYGEQQQQPQFEIDKMFPSGTYRVMNNELFLILKKSLDLSKDVWR